MALYFIWNGKDSRSMGIELGAAIPIIRPEERVEHVQIPGRSGDMTRLESDDDSDPVFNSYIQTATIEVKGNYRTREIFNWLRGSGYVTFHGEPDRRQEARIIGAITLNRHSKNSHYWVGECQFYCQPLKELLQGKSNGIASGGSVINTGDVKERPEWSFVATDTSATITVGEKTLEISGLTIGNAYLVRSDVQMVMTADKQTDLTAGSSGDFPVLEVGNNTVTGSGWSTITVWRKERFL